MQRTQLPVIIMWLIVIFLSPAFASGQVEQTRYYASGEQEKELQIIVHIWDEVNNPGKFIVRDGTNLVDLISGAGGPTKFARLNKVIITHSEESNPHVDVYDMKSNGILCVLGVLARGI